jgi:hypothetical protein
MPLLGLIDHLEAAAAYPKSLRGDIAHEVVLQGGGG